MEPKKKRILRLVAILLCVCVAISCGVQYYLSNYDLKIWYSLQDEEIQQEVRTQLIQQQKFSDEMWDYIYQQHEVLQKQLELSEDLAWAKVMDEKYQKEYGSNRFDDYAKELAELQRQYDDLSEEYDRLGLMIDYKASKAGDCWRAVEQLGFRGHSTPSQVEDILNNG